MGWRVFEKVSLLFHQSVLVTVPLLVHWWLHLWVERFIDLARDVYRDGLGNDFCP